MRQAQPPLGSQIHWAHPLARGLVACWLFNEGGGERLTDIAGVNHGTLTAMTPATDWVAGPRGYVLDFDGLNDYIAIDTSPSLRLTGAMTVVALVYDRDTGGSKYSRIATKFGTPTNQGWELTRQSSTAKMHFAVAVTASSSVEVQSVSTIPAAYANRWVHWAGVYVPSTALRLYRDGLLENENTASIPSSQRDSTAAVAIGRYIGGSAGSGFHDGRITNIAIWDRALSGEEIRALYEEPYAFVVPPRKIWKAAAGGGSFNPAWAHRSNLIVGGGCYVS